MLLALLAFYYDVLMQSFVSQYFREDIVVDEYHPYYRRYTEKYRKQRGVVKVFWIVAGALMAAFPVLHAVVAITLFTTFVSFSFLDESVS